jgi:hypothetical protein
MTRGVYQNSGHVSLVEPWRERTPQAVLKAKEARIRSLFADPHIQAARGETLQEVDHIGRSPDDSADRIVWTGRRNDGVHPAL